MKTSTGHTWTKVGIDSYKDESTKLTWGPEYPQMMTWDNAMKSSSKLYQILYLDETDTKLKWSLPTKEDFEIAEKHGIREVIDMKGKRFWSASVYSAGRSYAWVFYADGDGSMYLAGDGRDISYSVRCVGR